MITIEQLLKQNENADLLRISTAGSVDDGKSTLIGRLLHDARGIFEDQLAAVKKFSSSNRNQEIDYALITDGLKSEREQGITIDVAYRYFSTPRRRFIIADTPGHEQYTRNMATGASTAQLALILMDATKGVIIQTKRHSFISSLLGIRHVVVAVNKMDLVNYSEERFHEICETFRDYADKLMIDTIRFIPISALKGDNVTEQSPRMPWYKGAPLLEYLETVQVKSHRNLIDFRFPVQYVNWSGDGFRGYAGTISSGIIRKGDKVKSLPSGKETCISRIVTWEGDRDYAFAPQSVTLSLEDELDISRGDMIVRSGNVPDLAAEVESSIVWMDIEPLRVGKEYLFKHTSNLVRGVVEEIRYRLDPEDLHRHTAGRLDLNEVGRIKIRFLRPVFADKYTDNRFTGSIILIDPVTNLTSGAGMVVRTMEAQETLALESRPDSYTKGKVLWIYGKEKREHSAIPMKNNSNVILDEEALSTTLNQDIDENETQEIHRRMANMAKIISGQGINVSVRTFFQPMEEVVSFSPDIVVEYRKQEINSSSEEVSALSLGGAGE